MNATEPEKESQHLIPRSLSDSNLILGEYVFLRPTFPDDYRHFVDFFSNSKCIQYWGNGEITTENQLIDIFKEASAESAKQYPSEHHWTICGHEGIAGNIALYDLYGTNNRKAEIGYYINSKYQGRSYAVRAGKLALSFAHNHWPDDKPFYIEATVHPKNTASVSVLKNLSFMCDAERLSVPKYGSIRDYYILDSYGDSIVSKKTLNQRLIAIIAFKASVLAIGFCVECRG